MLKNNQFIFKLYQFGLLLIFLKSLNAWFFWDSFLVVFISFFSCLIFIATAPSAFSFKKTNLVPLFLFLIVKFITIRDGNINTFVFSLIPITILASVFLLNDQIKIDLFRFFTKTISILLAISLFAWILFLLGVTWPNSFTDFNERQYVFDNYYFFLHNYAGRNFIIHRFSSVFLEPGYLGILMVLFLYSNRFDFKLKSSRIFVLVALFTFSLAAYVLLAFTISIDLILKSKKSAFKLLLWVSFLGAFYFYFANYNQGENFANKLLFERLKYEDQDIAGNNRFSDALDDYYKKIMQSNDKYFGIGTANYNQITWEGGNAGYKVYVIKYGLIGTLFLFLFYYSMVHYNRTRLSKILLMLYILCFLRGSDPLLWESYLFTFITAMPVFQSVNQTEHN